MPMGSWTAAIGQTSALKRPMTLAAGLLFRPLTGTTILEALSTVRRQPPYRAWEEEREMWDADTGEAEGLGGGSLGSEDIAEVPAVRVWSVCLCLGAPSLPAVEPGSRDLGAVVSFACSVPHEGRWLGKSGKYRCQRPAAPVPGGQAVTVALAVQASSGGRKGLQTQRPGPLSISAKTQGGLAAGVGGPRSPIFMLSFQRACLLGALGCSLRIKENGYERFWCG